MHREQDPRVPEEVEEYLIALSRAAGERGGQIGVGIGATVGSGGLGGRRGTSRGARGAANAGAFAARVLKTTVEERSGVIARRWEHVVQQIEAELSGADRLGSDDGSVRYAVAWGRNSVQKVVVDMRLSTPQGVGEPPSCDVLLRAFCKEGLFSRDPTAKMADRLWAAASGDA